MAFLNVAAHEWTPTLTASCQPGPTQRGESFISFDSQESEEITSDQSFCLIYHKQSVKFEAQDDSLSAGKIKEGWMVETSPWTQVKLLN